MPQSPLEAHARLVDALRITRPFGRAVQRVETIETHISTVVLAGEFAYKVKKPVDLGFADFSTLGKRWQCCEDEVRLNRRTAPQVYLEVVAITGSIDRPVIGGQGVPIEYAVKMRRFPSESTLDALLRDGKLGPDGIDALARKVAAFHGSIRIATQADGHGSVAQVREAALDNFRQSRSYLADRASLEALDRLDAWTQDQCRRLAPTLEKRQRCGFVRECHGDLHLANVAWIDGEPVPFDCIEFNASLRWIDVMSEVAFTTMDLLAHRERGLAFRFLNAYLEETGDYKGIALLRFYLVYRAMVRAKVAAIQKRGTDFDRYLRLAEGLANQANPGLVITCGLSGSGKTTIARSLAGRIGAVHVRSDVERKRLHGLASRVRARASLESGIYAERSTATTYERLARIARCILDSGFPIIVDATFLQRSQRRAFRDLARRAGARFVIVRCEAPVDALRARLAAREGTGDASDATPAVLDRQLAIREGFTPAEADAAVDCDTLDRRKIAEALSAVEARLAA